MRFTTVARALGAGMLLLPAHAAQAQTQAQTQTDTMATIRGRGALICGVSPSTAGFALPDSQGVWRGLDVDIRRAIASALLGDADLGAAALHRIAIGRGRCAGPQHHLDPGAGSLARPRLRRDPASPTTSAMAGGASPRC